MCIQSYWFGCVADCVHSWALLACAQATLTSYPTQLNMKPIGWIPFKMQAATKVRLIKKDIPPHLASLDILGSRRDLQNLAHAHTTPPLLGVQVRHPGGLARSPYRGYRAITGAVRPWPRAEEGCCASVYLWRSGTITTVQKVLDCLQISGEGSVGLTHHIVKRDGTVWTVSQDTPTVFVPKLKARRGCW